MPNPPKKAEADKKRPRGMNYVNSTANSIGQTKVASRTLDAWLMIAIGLGITLILIWAVI